MNEQTKFMVEKTWRNALDSTNEGLMPIAVKLKELYYEEDFIPDPEYTRECRFVDKKPYITLCMTTTFSEPEYSGKWSHALVPEYTCQRLAELVYKKFGVNRWVYFSQQRVTEDDV